MELADGNVFKILLMVGLILLISGWLSFFYRDLAISKTQICCWGGLFLLAANLSPVTFFTHIWVHPVFILMIGVFGYLFIQLSPERRWFLMSVSVSSAAFLFLVHEMLLVHANWDDFTFRFIVLMTVWGVSLYAANRWTEQWTCGLLMLFLLHGFILLFHHEMLSPLFIGASAVLDTIGLSLCGFLVFRGISLSVEKWLEKWGWNHH